MPPDYTTARADAGFSWHISGSQSALRALAGVPIRDFNLEPAACIEAYRLGRPRLRELFGPDVRQPALATPAVSYGHVNALGCPLDFPVGGEVCQRPVYGSLAEGLRRLAEPVEFATAGLTPFYLDFRERLREAFPAESVGFSFGLEGPITSAYTLRGTGFFCDLYDDPPRTVEFLARLTDSIIAWARFCAEVEGRPFPRPHSAGMCDDLASFIPPARFADVVLPAWERYFSGLTSGRRHAHVEDLRAEQLPFLEAVGLAHFDPGISGKLSPPLLRDHCRVPFAWRLGAFHYPALTERLVEDFVYRAAAEGASTVFTIVEEVMCAEPTAAKVRTFGRAARRVAEHLSAGGTRAELAGWVSDEGRERFWGRWWDRARHTV